MEFGFPWWIRAEHFLNIIFITFFIRSGIEILGTFPRLHTSEHTPAGKQWAQFTIKEKKKHKYYSVGSEYENYSPIISLPGRGLLGQGRYWHFITVAGFVTCTIIYFVLLIFTGQWRRYVPNSLDVFPQAFNDMMTYMAFQIPDHMPGMPFNAVQQLSYGFVILLLGPFMIFTGFMQSPAVANHWPKLTKALGSRQVIRSAHWWGLVAYLAFIVIHVFMVIAHGYGHEVSKMVFGHTEAPTAAAIIFTMFLTFVVFLHVVATKTSLNNGRLVEKLNNIVVRPLTRQLIKLESRQTITDDRITPNHRASGHAPEADTYKALVAHGYEEDFVLEIGGLVERPMSLTLKDLHELAQGHSQTTLHHCVQGFSSVGKWEGIPVHALLELVKPLPGATDVIYMSHQRMGRDDPLYSESWYYDSNSMLEASQPQSLIAIGLNSDELPIKNGAPVRLRVETSTGFRSVKWLERIEVVNRYDIIGEGRGGWFEDNDYYDRMQMI